MFSKQSTHTYTRLVELSWDLELVFIERQSRTHFSAQVEPDVVIKMVHLGATRGQIQSYSLSLHSSNIDPNFSHVGRSWLQLQKFWQILLLCFSYAFIVQTGFLHDLFWKANIIKYLQKTLVNYYTHYSLFYYILFHKMWIMNFLLKVSRQKN